MNRKNTLRLLVLLLSLVLAVTAFAACNTTGPSDETSGSGSASTSGTPSTDESTEAPARMTAIKLGDYTVCAPENTPAVVTDAVNTFIASAQEKLGAEFAALTTDDVAAGDLEILIGATNRPESAEALADLNGAVGYVVKMVGNKIVINAEAPGLIDEALQFFLTEYVEKGANGSFEIPEALAVSKQVDGASLVDTSTGAFRYEMVFSKDLDTTEGTADGDRVDYVVNYFMDLRADLLEAVGLDDIVFTEDSVAAAAGAPEVLLGRTNRQETNTFLASLKPNEYGYGVVGNKLVIAGWSDFTIGLAVDLFCEDLASYVVESNGVKNVVLCEGDRTVEAYAPWNVDVPLYNAGRLDGAVELINSGYLAYYVDTTPEEYKAYRAFVEQSGYKLLQENEIGKNLYATYADSKTLLHAYYVDYLGAVRVIVESRQTAVIPDTDTELGEKVTDLTLTAFDFDSASGNWGNCFIVTLEDGSFILHDGGADKGGKDCTELWNLLNKLNKRKDGKIVIAAWIISHQHYDHFKNGYDLIKKYYKQGLVVEQILYNVPSPSLEYNSNNPGTYFKGGKFHEVQRWTNCQLTVLHTGQKIQIHGYDLDVLYTCDDIYPLPPVKFNNSAFILRMWVGEGENEQILTIIGDAEEVACGIMSDMYGEAMKCDIVSVAHHGWGGSVEAYGYFKPSVVVWPYTQEEANKQLASGSTGYYPTIHQSLMNQANVKMLVVGDYGHRTFKLPVLGLTDNDAENLENLVTVWPREDGLTH